MDIPEQPFSSSIHSVQAPQGNAEPRPLASPERYSTFTLFDLALEPLATLLSSWYDRLWEIQDLDGAAKHSTFTPKDTLIGQLL